jgi:beta-1,4-mannosyl-glycoprotein beta-1,4-N-acetylglucosaminyltransferase
MTYEFFYLHDEIDWLDVKLHEAGDEVDKFIVIECPYDLLHKKKPLYYGENIERFAYFRDKIIHIVAEDRIVEGVNMVRTRLAECYQGFSNCGPDDILIVTDPDAVLKRSTYQKIKQCNMQNHEVAISMDWYFYYMDYLFTKEKFTCCSAFLYKNTVDSEWGTVNRFRPVGTVIQDAGWHFSKMGGVKALTKHLNGYPHGNCDYPNLIGEEATEKLMQFRIDEGLCWEGGYPGKRVVQYVPYDPKNYPAYVNEHPELFAQFFRNRGMGDERI